MVQAVSERLPHLWAPRLSYSTTQPQLTIEIDRARRGLAYAGTLARLQALRIAIERNRTAYRQSQQLCRDGFASFIDVLDSQRELNTSLQELAIAEQNLSLAVVDLYSALGGSLPVV